MNSPAQDALFDEHGIFSAREIRRMSDVVYSLTIVISMLSTYFHRSEELEPFLERYNDEFPEDAEIRNRFARTRDFVRACDFPSRSRAWKKTDLLVLVVELDRLLNKENVELDPQTVGPAVEEFYQRVEVEMQAPSGDEDLQAYFRTTVQATNDRSSRLNRGRVIRKVILAAGQ